MVNTYLSEGKKMFCALRKTTGNICFHLDGMGDAGTEAAGEPIMLRSSLRGRGRSRQDRLTDR